MLVGDRPESWRPAREGGRSRRLVWRVGEAVVVLVLLSLSGASVSSVLFVRRAEANLTRIPVPELIEAASPSEARGFLLVGSDSRAGLTDADRAQLTLGDFVGQRSDTMIYAAISEDRGAVTLVSLPRDLLVFDTEDRRRKLTETYAGGPDALVAAIQRNLGLPVNHFVQVSLGGFIEIVRTLGTVEICLERPLVDVKSGADLPEGCSELGPRESLAFVRSRQGPRADYERIDRQQQFLRAVLARLTDTRVLVDPRRTYQLVEDVASNLVTDDGLGLDQMRSLSGEMLAVVRDGVPMMTLPSYPQRVDGIWYVLPYGPGARALLEDLRAGRVPPDRGTAATRRTTGVLIFSGGRSREATIVQNTLAFAGFRVVTAGPGPADIDARATTIVYSVPGGEVPAGWVAATLGTTVVPLPEGFRVPEGTQVVVAVGDDAGT
jgi:LCP family protein required for cell wall assembly